MQTKTSTLIDKSKWGDGPWQQEPDAVFWQDPATDLPCLIARGDYTGALCGYVGVPEGHPLYGKERFSKELKALDAHGGINFAACIKKTDFLGWDKYERYWFIGFDCAHAWDYNPAQEALLKEIMPSWDDLFRDSKIYRDIAYVTQLVDELALQLANKKE